MVSGGAHIQQLQDEVGILGEDERWQLLLQLQNSKRVNSFCDVVLIMSYWSIFAPLTVYQQCGMYISSTGFLYPAKDVYIQPGIYISTTGSIYPPQDLYIQHGMYISSTGFIYPAQDVYIYTARDLYIHHRIYKSSQGFIYPARDLYIPHGINHLWSQNIVTCCPRARV